MSSSGAVEITDGSESGVETPCSVVHDGNLVICSDNCAPDAISDTEAVRNIRVVSGRLSVVRSELEDLGALGCLEEVGLSVTILDNPALNTLDGATRLASIGALDPDGGYLEVDRNPRLESLGGLKSLAKVGAISVSHNESLQQLGLDGIEQIGLLLLGVCTGGQQGSHASAGGDNPALTTFDGFDALQSIDHLSVSGQSALTSIDRLTELAQAGVEFGEAEFHLNPGLDTTAIEAFMAASGAAGMVCENLGDDTPCVCPWGE